MKSGRWKCTLLAAPVALLLSSAAVEAAVKAAPQFGPAEVLLDAAPGQPSNASALGFVLVARDRGPQVALMARRGACLAGLQSGEEATMAIPVKGIAGEVVVTARAANVARGPAEVSLSSDGKGPWRALAPGAAADLTISATAARDVLVLHLKARCTGGTEEAAVRWSAVRLKHAGQTADVPLSVAPGDPWACPLRELPPLRPAIEAALVEWDWRMQDGLGTERAPSTYAAAVQRTLDRGDRLIADLAASGASLAVEALQWEALRRRWKDLAAAAAEEAAWEDLWRSVHVLRRRIALANPLVPLRPLVFVKQAPSMFSHQLTQYTGNCARPGGGLFVLENPGRSMRCRPLAAGKLPPGSYQFAEVSFDGARVLFAYCRADSSPVDREKCLDRFYHLYEAGADGSTLRQLTDGPFDDFAPRYLPGGKIIFISTRRQGFHRCGRGPCPVHTLAICNSDGSDPRPISYHETHEWDPAVLHDGRVLYTRWDYVDRNAVHYQQLWTVRQDGSDVRIYYGNNTWNPIGVWEARPVPGSQRVMATAAAHHAMTAGSTILLDVTRGIDGPEPITRLTPDALFPESEAPVANRRGPGAWHAPVGVVRRPPVPEEQVRWPGHCYRTPLPLSERYFLAAYSYDPLIGEPDANQANMFGLYLVDAAGNKELLYRDLNISSLWPAPLGPRSKPAALPSVVEAADEREGTFFLQNVYESWPPLPSESIKRLRIVQVLPKSTWHANDPPLGLPSISPGKQVLGTVPVEPDGSALFRAPAGIPLAFQALDERGQAVQIMRSLTYLQPGEKVSCVGCHEPRRVAPRPRGPAQALLREPSQIEPGPDGSNPLSYPILVQPVLERHCVSCHRAGKAEGGVVLTGEPQGHYTASYNALARLVPYSDWAGKPGDFRVVNNEPTTTPGFFGARGSKLMALLWKGHYDVRLGGEDLDRLITWMDANVLFYGTFDPQDQARQRRGERIAGPKIQ